MSLFVELPTDSYPDQLPGFGPGPAFSFPTAQAMMWLAQLAYEPDRKIETILRRWQLPVSVLVHSAPESDTATQGFVCRRGAATIVTFAGTDPGKLKTVLTDFETLPDHDGIHPGFRHALDGVWDQVRTAVHGRPAGPLFVAGHSLGAALAVLAAFQLRTQANTTADGVYTFGMPRVGGEAFGASYEPILGARTYRHVNGDDPVPSVPPPLAGFRHVGRSLFCPHEGRFDPTSTPAVVRDDAPGFLEQEVKNAADSLVSFLNGILPVPVQPGALGVLDELLPGGIADHLQARYLAALGTPVR